MNVDTDNILAIRVSPCRLRILRWDPCIYGCIKTIEAVSTGTSEGRDRHRSKAAPLSASPHCRASRKQLGTLAGEPAVAIGPPAYDWDVVQNSLSIDVSPLVSNTRSTSSFASLSKRTT